MPLCPTLLSFSASIFQYPTAQMLVEPARRLGRVGAGDRYVASAVAENRSAADESGSELVSQVAWVLLASWVDLEKAGAGGCRKSTAAAGGLDCVDVGRYGCQVRHDEVSTAPEPRPPLSWTLRPPAWAMSAAP